MSTATSSPMEIRLEQAHCPRCGVPPERLVRRSHSFFDDVPGAYEVRACPRCGMWITSPRPREEDLPLVYPESYVPYRASRTERPAPAGGPVMGSLLDVGCGSGKYLELARQEGWRAVGIEPSEQAAAVAESRGFEVIVGDALTVAFPAERFDRVRCAHVLEHVTDPVLLLTRMRDAVKPGGSLEILVPNPRSFCSRVFRNYWHGLELPRHLYHYRVEDIRALARCTGMEVTRIHYSSSPSALLWSVDRVLDGRRRLGSRWLRDNSRLRRLSHPLTWLIARMRLADVVEYRLESTPA